MFNWLRLKFIEILGGYTDVDSALDSITDQKQKQYVLTLAVKRLFNTIGSDDILKVNSAGQWMVEGKIITEQKKTMLIAEATNFQKTELWRVLQLDIKYQANRKMFLLSQDDLSLTAGKLWTLTLDAIKTRLESLDATSGSFNHKNKV